jgi:stage II sporulation protein M
LTLPSIFDRTIKPYIGILVSIFVASFLAGTVAPVPLQKEAAEAFKYLAEEYQGLSGGALFFYILSHNLMASILILYSGVLFGIIPILSIGANGVLLGVLYRQAAEGIGYSKAALMVLPHGVFEIPALLIAASYGLWLGVMAVRRMRGKESTLLRFHIGHASRRYLAVVFPLLIVAAAIETALIVF